MAVARSLLDRRQDLVEGCGPSWWQERCQLLRAQRLEADWRGTSVSASMGLVRCYADLIQKYWEHLQATGELGDKQTLPVLQWGAGTGCLAYRLLRELRERLTVSSLSSRDLLYVACDEDAGAVEFMRAHPRLQEDQAAGRLLVRHVVHSEPQVWREVIQESLPRPAAPLVIIANDVFMEAEQELAALFGGKVFDATWERKTPVSSVPASPSWTERPTTGRPSSPWQSLLRSYATRLDGVAVLLPTGALDFIELCSQLTGGHYLLLATDSGIHCERQLRAGVYADITAHPLVNFDALSRQQRRNGALTCNLAADSQGRVVHIALQGSKQRGSDNLFGSLQQALGRYVPGRAEAALRLLQSSKEETTCEQLLTAVRLADDDPRALALVAGLLVDRLDRLTLECCMQWRSTIEHVWNNYFPTDQDGEFWLDIGLVALHVGHWGVAKSAFALGLAMDCEDPEVLYRLSYCEAATGHSPNALSLIQRARTLDPENQAHRELESVLLERLREWDTRPWYRRGACSDGELTLEPLGAVHAESLLFQYRDPQIGVMTRLPEFETKADVLAWLEKDSNEPGCISCAVMHAAWGFVGAVTLRQDAERAYFYFWVGADYQGAGLGQRCARLLLEQAPGLGVTHVFTSAYTSNFRSCAALRRLGFGELDISALEPDDDLSFFLLRSGAFPDVGGDVCSKLRELLRNIDSPITLTSK